MRLTTPNRATPPVARAQRDGRRAARPGFTLVELLVVIAIIAILVSLTGAAIQKTVEGQRNRSTKDQLQKLQKAVDLEYERVVKACADDQRKPNGIPKEIVDYADKDPNRALAIWTALKLRQHFPESFAEALTGIQVVDINDPTKIIYTLWPLETFRGELQGASSNGVPNEESGALLYIILTKKSVSGGGAMGTAGDDLSQSMKRRVNFGAKELETFSDAWGNTVGFRRWDQNPEVQTDQTYLDLKPNQFNPNNKDPLDPRNLVLGWTPDPYGKSGQMKSFLLFNGMNRVTTVYSPGKDQTTGTPDDIIGYRLRRHGN